eukprot:113004-Pelagomonas_calceolata.AAC.6
MVVVVVVVVCVCVFVCNNVLHSYIARSSSVPGKAGRSPFITMVAKRRGLTSIVNVCACCASSEISVAHSVASAAQSGHSSSNSDPPWCARMGSTLQTPHMASQTNISLIFCMHTCAGHHRTLGPPYSPGTPSTPAPCSGYMGWKKRRQALSPTTPPGMRPPRSPGSPGGAQHGASAKTLMVPESGCWAGILESVINLLRMRVMERQHPNENCMCLRVRSKVHADANIDIQKEKAQDVTAFQADIETVAYAGSSREQR